MIQPEPTAAGDAMPNDVVALEKCIKCAELLVNNYPEPLIGAINLKTLIAAKELLALKKANPQPVPADPDRCAKLERIIAELHWMARRYADMRLSAAPSRLNSMVHDALGLGVNLQQPFFARDGMGREYDGLTDAEAQAAAEDSSRGLKAIPEPDRAGLVTMRAEIVEAIKRDFDQALRQWKMYSDVQDGTAGELGTAEHAEGQLYRRCVSTLALLPKASNAEIG